MFPNFLPSQVEQLQESESIALAQSIQRTAIKTPLSPQQIATAYVHQGSGGTPILLLPGFDSSVLEFRRLFPLLAAENETWAVDLLGFGFTERVQGISCNPAAIKTHLYYFWNLIKEPMILVGASMGGAAAIDFTLTYPHAVKKLVLINSLGFSGSFPLGALLFPPFDFLAVEYWRQRKVQALLWGSHFGNLKPNEIEAIKCAMLHIEMLGWHEATSSFTKSGGYWDLADKISRIDKPTLILWGESDDMLGTADAQRFKNAIANSQLIWIANCGHVPQLEQPQITAEYILGFR
ncbi:alpha/beta hydrolase [Cyanobacteria bacterium FACHB-472]|nr:alpha/beta hydrolase [Cyanobacteria bacterium FACHB-472]